MKPDPLVFDSPIRQIFVGRERELGIIQRELLAPNAKTVFITGPPGIGKTALAMMFAELNQSAFPGGVHNLHATPFETVDYTVDRQVSQRSKPYLIIVNDLEVRPHQGVDHELTAVRRKHPNARILATSRFVHAASVVDLQLQLEGLSRAEFRALLERGLTYARDPRSIDELYSALMGNPLAARLVADLLNEREITPRELLERLQDFTRPGIVDSAGEEIPESTSEHRKIVANVVTVSDDFLRKLHENPKLLYDLSPRGFEELVAELLSRLGYAVTLTPVSRDGGKDIYAAKKDYLGTFLYIVECKKHAPDHPVGVGLVRQLNGVVQAEQATAGILATTSFFTRGAQKFQTTISFQISLKDYFGIQEWLESVFKE